MSNLQQIQTLFFNEPNQTSKSIYRGGEFTKKFLKFNRKLITEGKAIYYADQTKVINPKTGRPINKLTKTGRVKQKFKGDKLVGSIIKDKSLGREFFFSGGDERLKKNWLLFDIIKNNNIVGKYRLVIKVGQETFDYNVNIPASGLSGWYNSQLHPSLQLTSGYMIWNGIISEGDYILFIDRPVNFIFTKETKLSQAYFQQVFKDNKTQTCIFEPIREWLDYKLESSKSKSYKEKCKKLKNKIFGWTKKNGELKEGYIHKYLNGMPQDKLGEFCEEANIGIDIFQPFKKDPIISLKPAKRHPKKVFSYINTNMNHVEGMPLEINDTNSKSKNWWEKVYCDNGLAEEKTREELLEIYQDAIDNNKTIIYNKDCYGINQIKTPTKAYYLNTEYDAVINKFQFENNIYQKRLNASKHPELVNFIYNGTHFNGTIDFKDLDNENKSWDNIGHIDMANAYINYDKCKFYNGFAMNITDFRPMDNYNYGGYYLVDSINSVNVNKNIKDLVDNLGWFWEGNIYTQPELKMFESYGYKIKVSYGAIALENEELNLRDWEDGKLLTTKAIITKDRSVKGYCKLVGSWASLKETRNYFINCGKNFSRSFVGEHGGIYHNEYNNETRIEVPKKTIWSSTHLAGYITAYQRIILLDQLTKFNIDDLYRVCCDGIYFKEQEVELVEPFRIKEDKMTWRNSECEHYLSNIKREHRDYNLDFNISSKIYSHDIHLEGAGGSGKTYSLGIDKGLINVLYVAPSWILSADQSKFSKWDLSVKNRLFDKDYQKRGILTSYGNIVIDEGSMWTQGERDDLLNMIPDDVRVFWVADLKYQLPPVITLHDRQRLEKRFDGEIPQKYFQQMTRDSFNEIVSFNKIYRFKQGDKLHQLAKQIRYYIDNDYSLDGVMKKIKTQLPVVNDEYLKNNYNVNDTILCFTNAKNDYYTEMFKHLEKYKVLEMGFEKDESKVYNGTIKYKKPKTKHELRHGFTIHSMQGKTVNDNKLYIHDNINSLQMLYTAISRAVSIDQLFIIGD